MEGSVFGAISLWFSCLCMKSGTAERICTKFTWKTCLIPQSDEFEGQRSRSPGQKMAFFGLSDGLHAVWFVKHVWPLVIVILIGFLQCFDTVQEGHLMA